MRISPPLAPTCCVLALLAACASGETQDARSESFGTRRFALTAVEGFGSNPGGLAMYAYFPEQMPAHAPLVVAMHGCLMDAEDYANAGWNELADLWKYYVVYPETSTSMSCFAWYDPASASRDQGQALSIKQMVDYMVAHYDVDTSRIYVTGLSAGGAMTAVMLAAYPDLFAAGAPMAGVPYRCASSAYTSGFCMSPGIIHTPQDWGDRVREAFPGYTGRYPRVSIWQGAADLTVSTINLGELAKQWTDVHGIDDVPDVSAHEKTATHEQYRDDAGETLVETWMVDGMGHGTAVEPGWEPANGCGQAGSFVLSAGICSTWYAARFFGLEPSEPADAGTVTPEADAGTADAAVGEDAGSEEPETDAGTSVEPDAGSEDPVNDAGTSAETDAGTESSDASHAGVTEAEGCSCATPGTTFGSLAPISLLFLLPRRRRC
jgi:poly(hydroxyalkanoate) depolymerase family esterase